MFDENVTMGEPSSEWWPFELPESLDSGGVSQEEGM